MPSLNLESDFDENGSHERSPAAKAGISDLLDSACREALRMIPVVTTPSGRKLLKPVEIDGQVYAAGETLIPCTYLVHRREDLYPEPDRYNPERFLLREYKYYEYFPFGGGQRFCVGAQLAMTTIKSVLATLLNLVQLELVECGPVVPIRHGTLLTPSANLRFRVLR